MSVGPVVINEVDSDQAGADATEFIELVGPPIIRLDGTTIVAFNGAGDLSYNIVPSSGGINLDGLTTDKYGYLVIGNTAVPTVAYEIKDGSLQNGPDAVAFYLADGTDFPAGTAVTASKLIDALVYDSNDPDGEWSL